MVNACQYNKVNIQSSHGSQWLSEFYAYHCNCRMPWSSCTHVPEGLWVSERVAGFFATHGFPQESTGFFHGKNQPRGIHGTIVYLPTFTRWWFQICLIFIPTWGNDPIWLIFFSNGWNDQLVYHKNQRKNVGKYTMHRSYGIWFRGRNQILSRVLTYKKFRVWWPR